MFLCRTSTWSAETYKLIFLIFVQTSGDEIAHSASLGDPDIIITAAAPSIVGRGTAKYSNVDLLEAGPLHGIKVQYSGTKGKHVSYHTYCLCGAATTCITIMLVVSVASKLIGPPPVLILN